jgi:hypothetical protein
MMDSYIVFQACHDFLRPKDLLNLRTCSRDCKDLVDKEARFQHLAIWDDSSWIPTGPHVRSITIHRPTLLYPRVLQECPNLVRLTVACKHLNFSGCKLPRELVLLHPCYIPDTRGIRVLYFQSIYADCAYRVPTFFPDLTHIVHHPHYPPPFPISKWIHVEQKHISDVYTLSIQ